MIKLLRVAALLSCALLTACAGTKDTAVFITKTSLGFDVESTPPSASIGYDRVEGYFGPRYDTGSLPAVSGIFETDGGLLDRKVRQTYATGTAAHLVTSPNSATPTFATEHFSGERKEMFFGTGTVLGVRLAFGSAGVQDFTFGYKRKEISVIPVSTTVSSVITPSGSTATSVTHVFAPVFAHFDNLTEPDTLGTSTFTVKQFFATGRAAEQMAYQLREPFKKEAEALLLSQYRDAERLQTNHALRALHCVAKLPDARLGEVWRNAEQLNIFKDSTVPASLRSATPHDARAIYTGQLRLIEASSRERTVALKVHENFVCS
jgi:hypothetical protein